MKSSPQVADQTDQNIAIKTVSVRLWDMQVSQLPVLLALKQSEWIQEKNWKLVEINANKFEYNLPSETFLLSWET